MRAVHMHRIAGIGGSERHLLTLLPALVKRGLEVTFLGLDDPVTAPDPFYRELDASGVEVVRLGARCDVDPRLARDAARAMRRLRPDVVCTHLVHADVYGALGATAARAALVSTKHNDDPFRAGMFRHVERLLTRRAARVICITESLARFNRERVGLPAEKLTVVRYGLDDVPSAWPGGAAGPTLPPSARVLLAVSRLTQQKGIDVAIRALPAIRTAHPDAVLVVLGEGPERGQLARLALELGVSDAVYLPGRVGDVAAWYRRAEMLVHPARWEGFGLALLEAMLSALPIVASRVSSIPELVVSSETGLLVEPDDPAALAEAVSRVLDDPGALGERGLERARLEFSVAEMAERTLAVYERAVSSAER